MCKEMVKSGQWTPAVRRLDDARRRLGGSKKPRPDTIFEGFSLHPEICATLVAIVIVFCAIFLKLVEVVPKAILFGVYFMEVAGLVALSVRYQNITFGAAAVILALYAYFRRADIPPKSRGDAAVVAWIFRGEESRRRRGRDVDIPRRRVAATPRWWRGYSAETGARFRYATREKTTEAAKLVGAAAHCLASYPSLLVYIFCWILVMAALIIVLVLVATATGGNFEVVEYEFQHTCEFQLRSNTKDIWFVCYVIWNWIFCFATTVLIYFVAGSVAHVSFGGKAESSVPLKLMNTAMTTNAGADRAEVEKRPGALVIERHPLTPGTTAGVAFVLDIVDFIDRRARICTPQNVCFWPVTILALLIKHCCLACLRMVSKFALIFHSITGDALCDSGRRTVELLKQAGYSAIVLETSALNA